MRIGIDATALPPQPVGAGNYMIQLIRALAALEDAPDLVIFAHQHGAALISVPPNPRLSWVVLPDRSPAQRLVWEQAIFPKEVRAAGVDLLHSLHYTRPFTLPCPSVVTFHDLTFFLFPHLHTRSKRLFFPNAMRFSARRAEALIAISENTRQDAIRLLGIPPAKIFTTPLAVTGDFRPVSDPAKLEPVRQKYKLPAHFILYVGVVEPRKNLPQLLRAYKNVVTAGCTLPLVIVGRFGWMYEEVLHLIDQLGLKERIQFTGYVPGEDLPIVYNLADIFVYPSLYEGFGLPPLEAMACGTPVITTAVSSMPEHVGDAGLLIPPQDEDALTQALLRLLKDTGLQNELAQKGPRQAAQFTWKRTAQQTLFVYQHVLTKV